MKTMMVGLLAVTAAWASTVAARADDSKSGLYQISEINILPTVVEARKNDVSSLIRQMVKDTRGDEGLVSIDVTQQIGQSNNYTVVEQWRGQAALDKHTTADHTRKFGAQIADMLSGPIYQRVFRVFQ